MNGWKIGFSSGLILLGVYILFSQSNTPSIILGIIGIAAGLGLLASD